MAAKYEDFTECSICFETMINPKKLPCDHTFCEVCVKKLIIEDSREIKCPMDNKMFSAEEVRPDFKHAQVLELLSSRKGTPLPSCTSEVVMNGVLPVRPEVCGLCDENEAQFWCKVCAFDLCRTCKKGHTKMLKEHSVVTRAEKLADLQMELLSRHAKLENILEEYSKFVQLYIELREKSEKSAEEAEKELKEFENEVWAIIEDRKQDLQRKREKMAKDRNFKLAIRNEAYAKTVVGDLKNLIESPGSIEYAERKCKQAEEDFARAFQRDQFIMVMQFEIKKMDLKNLMSVNATESYEKIKMKTSPKQQDKLKTLWAKK